MNERNSEIDRIKLFLMLSIYVGHYGNSAGRLYPFVFTFHVAAFCFISGFFAVNNCKKYPPAYIKTLLERYLLPWIIWVFVTVVFYAFILNSGAKSAAYLLKTYLLAVRGSGIGGMWYIPFFCMMSLIYFFVYKAIVLFGVREKYRTVFICLIAFSVFVIYSKYSLIQLPKVFSLDYLPHFFFYYCLGAVVYPIYTQLCKRKNAPIVIFCTQILGIAYMAMVYFEKENFLWAWTRHDPTNLTSFLPEMIRIPCAILMLSILAKIFDSELITRLGRNTLTLCMTENVAKESIYQVLILAGMTLGVQNGFQAIIMSMVAMIAAEFILHPFLNKLTDLVKYFISTLAKAISGSTTQMGT